MLLECAFMVNIDTAAVSMFCACFIISNNTTVHHSGRININGSFSISNTINTLLQPVFLIPYPLEKEWLYRYSFCPLCLARIPSVTPVMMVEQWYGLSAGVTAEDRPLPVGFPWPNPTCPVALVPCDYGQEKSGTAPAPFPHAVFPHCFSPTAFYGFAEICFRSPCKF